jgi:hypothetical protein
LEQAADYAVMAAPSLRFGGGRTWGDANWVLEARLGDRPGRALLTVHRFRPDDESAAPAAYHEPHVLRFRIALQDPLHGGDDAPRTARGPAEAAGVLQDWASLPDEPFRRALQAPPLDLGDLERLRILAAARRDARGRADSLVIVDAPFREKDGDPADWTRAPAASSPRTSPATRWCPDGRSGGRPVPAGRGAAGRGAWPVVRRDGAAPAP